MSYNYLEVAVAVEKISEEMTGAIVEDVSLVHFPVSEELADLNLAIKADGHSIVFSLKSPWVAMHMMPSNAFWIDRKANWQRVFKGLHDFRTELVGTKILSIHSVKGERMVSIGFSNRMFLNVELFSAKPRISYSETEELAAQIEKTANDRKFEVRDFGADWLKGSYDFYLEKRWQDFTRQIVQNAVKALDTRAARLMKIKTEIVRSMREIEDAENIRAKGEAIKAELHEFKGDERAKKIEESEKYFAKYKKLVRTAKEIKPRSEMINTEIAKSRKFSAELQEFKKTATESWKDFLKRFKAFTRENGLSESAQEGAAKKPPNKNEKKWQKSGIRRYESKEGLAIWVGRTHEENEELVIRLAKGNDLWFHLKGKPGAHVVVQVSKGKSASLETMLDAANLCVHFSNVNENDKVDVDYTFRKNVKRVSGKGANSNGKFLVTYTQNKTLVIKADQPRLTRLLSSSKM